MASLLEIQDEYLAHLKRGAARKGIHPPAFVLPEEHEIQLGQLRFHYLDWGGEADAPKLVFLHGGGLNAHTWDLCALMLRPRYRCYAMDLRGHGDSDWAADNSYTLADYAADVRALVCALNLERFVLVGMSLGGLIALTLASQGVAGLAGLVVVDVAPRAPGAERPGAGPINRFYGRTLFDSVEAAVEYALAFNPRRNPESLKFSMSRNLRVLPSGQWTWKADMRRREDSSRRRFDEEARALWHDSARIACPTLIVRGEESAILPLELAEAFVAQVPGAMLRTAPNSGHTVQGDNPTALLDLMAPFFDSLDLSECAEPRYRALTWAPCGERPHIGNMFPNNIKNLPKNGGSSGSLTKAPSDD